MQFFIEKVIISSLAKGDSRFNVAALYNVDQNISLTIIH